MARELLVDKYDGIVIVSGDGLVHEVGSYCELIDLYCRLIITMIDDSPARRLILVLKEILVEIGFIKEMRTT